MPASPQTLTTALEDYLESIAWLVRAKGVARVRDISAALSVHKSTVTSALRSLADKGLVNYSAYEAATLTAEGQKIADEVIRRHEIVRDFFMEVLGVEREIADANACRMEHELDAEVLERLACFARFVRDCPSSRQRCLKRFQVYFKQCAEEGDALGPVCEAAAVKKTVAKKKYRRQSRGK
jgi:DtxR family transcriptional regulator, Mn-dependent transcriptional regulator